MLSNSRRVERTFLDKTHSGTPPPITHMGTTIDLHLPSVAVGGKNLTYYLAVSAVLFLAWTWRARKPAPGVDAPFHKASKLKWWFDAETEIINSYNKVRGGSFAPRMLERWQWCERLTGAVPGQGVPDQGDRGRPGPHTRQLNRGAQGAAGRCAQLRRGRQRGSPASPPPGSRPRDIADISRPSSPSTPASPPATTPTS